MIAKRSAKTLEQTRAEDLVAKAKGQVGFTNGFCITDKLRGNCKLCCFVNFQEKFEATHVCTIGCDAAEAACLCCIFSWLDKHRPLSADIDMPALRALLLLNADDTDLMYGMSRQDISKHKLCNQTTDTQPQQNKPCGI